jgi:hypothetical protein
LVCEAPVAVSPKLWLRCTAVSPKLWPYLYSMPQMVEGSTCPGGRLPIPLRCLGTTHPQCGDVHSISTNIVEAAHPESGCQPCGNLSLVGCRACRSASLAALVSNRSCHKVSKLNTVVAGRVYARRCDQRCCPHPAIYHVAHGVVEGAAPGRGDLVNQHRGKFPPVEDANKQLGRDPGVVGYFGGTCTASTVGTEDKWRPHRVESNYTRGL